MIPYDELPQDNEKHVILHLTDAQIDVIAARVEDRMLIRIGRRVIDKILWAVGICVLAVAVWLNTRGAK